MQNQGFSLLEMMIVLLIFGIILSFAYPNYQSHFVRAHRLEGQLALLDLANRMEHHFANYESYAEATMGTNSVHDVLAVAETSQGYYRLVILHASETHFTLQAIPRGSQAQADTRCQTLQLNDLGLQEIVSGPGGVPTGTWEECWA